MLLLAYMTTSLFWGNRGIIAGEQIIREFNNLEKEHQKLANICEKLELRVNLIKNFYKHTADYQKNQKDILSIHNLKGFDIVVEYMLANGLMPDDPKTFVVYMNNNE